MKIKYGCFLLCLTFSVMAAEVAVTGSGRKVVLHNDGTWENFDPSRHLEGKDLRDPQERVQIFLKYKDHQYLVDEIKLYLEGMDYDTKFIQDSLKRVPAGGVVLVEAPEDYVNSKDPRTFEYTVKSGSGQVLVQQQRSEQDAVAADQPGVMILTELPIRRVPKEGRLMVQLKNVYSGQLYEYEISLEGS